MGLDEARAGDHGAGVDHLRARGVQVRADGDDRAVAHVDVAVRQIADRRVHAQHEGVADEVFASLSGATGRLGLRQVMSPDSPAAPAAAVAPSGVRSRHSDAMFL